MVCMGNEDARKLCCQKLEKAVVLECGHCNMLSDPELHVVTVLCTVYGMYLYASVCKIDI